MPKRPKIELDSHLVEKTISRFRYHRPPVYGEVLADPEITSDPYSPYDFEAAATDVMFDVGFDFRQKGNIALKSALAKQAKSQVPNANVIIERRQKIADELNKFFRLEYGID